MSAPASVQLWRISADTPKYVADDVTGAGAKATGGRWNRKGNAVLYTAPSISLACLETVVHLGAMGLPLNRYLVEITVPSVHWAARTKWPAPLPSALVGWDALPAGKVSLDYGDDWLASGAALLAEVPSVIVPEEFNVLVNPAHPDAASITARKVRKWTYDARLAASASAVGP